MPFQKEFVGETIGTFVLVLFGTGSVAVSILFGAYQGLMQIGLAWGIGVTLSIYLTRLSVQIPNIEALRNFSQKGI